MSNCEIALAIVGVVVCLFLVWALGNWLAKKSRERDDLEFRMKVLEGWASSQGSDHPQPPPQPLG